MNTHIIKSQTTFFLSSKLQISLYTTVDIMKMNIKCNMIQIHGVVSLHVS